MIPAKRLLTLLEKAETFICFCAFAAMAIILMIDVGMREVLGLGWYGASQRATMAMVVLVFIALGLATSHGAHLRPRFADGLLPETWEPIILRLSDILTACFYGFVSLVAIFVVIETFSLGDRVTTINWILWPIQSVMIVAFGIGALRHSLYALFPPLRPDEDARLARSDNALGDSRV